MKKINLYAGLIILKLLFLTNTCLFAEDFLWVNSKGAKLKSDKTATSETIAKLPIGTRLAAISYMRKWYRVATPGGKQGWIYRGKVSKTRPDATSTKDEDNLFGDVVVSNVKAGAADTSRSIRGLSPEATEYAKRRNLPAKYSRELDIALSIHIDDTEIERFLAEGEIGEYAE